MIHSIAVRTMISFLLGCFCVSACASILSLGFSISPYAVGWTVVTVIVFSFESKAIWAFAHVFYKVLELPPSGRDLYSASAVIGKIGDILVVAPSNHGAPTVIDNRFAHAVGRGANPHRCSAARAATTFSATGNGPKFPRNHDNFAAAFAHALPFGRNRSAATNFTYGSELAESLALKNRRFHRVILTEGTTA